MNYKEMLTKTGMKLVGICKGINEYVSKKTGESYFSVDLEIQGCRAPVNVKLPADFDRTKLVEYELTSMSCIVRPTFDRKNIEIMAVA